jgi:hypothetical protein
LYVSHLDLSLTSYPAARLWLAENKIYLKDLGEIELKAFGAFAKGEKP